MKLSEAIRLGAMLKPQARGYTSDEHGSCALGAALEAVGVAGAEYPRAFYLFDICSVRVAHPFGSEFLNGEDWPVLSVVRDLNDTHRWTRERIADWVETIEQQQVQTQESPTAVEAQ